VSKLQPPSLIVSRSERNASWQIKQNAAVEALPDQEKSVDFDEIPEDFEIR